MMFGRRTGLRWCFEGMLVFLASLVVLFVVAPLAGMFFSTTFGEVWETAGDAEVIDSIGLTLRAAFFATVVSMVGGIPLGYLLARGRFRGRALLATIIELPVIVPHSAAGIALFGVVGRGSLLGKLVDGGLVGTSAGISVAMAFVSVPFLVSAARDGFAGVDVNLEKAARSLGASPGRVFFTISLPLAWRGIVSGLILMWARGISEFGAVVIIAYHPMTTPVMVYERFNNFGLAEARSVAVVLILICVSLFVLLRVFSGHLKETEDVRA